MSTAVYTETSPVLDVCASRASFAGTVRGEFFKVSRQLSTWIMGFLLMGIIVFPYLVTFAAPTFKTRMMQQPLAMMYFEMGSNLFVLRVFSGFFLIVLTARLIGMEYSAGTIRIVLARGVGRVQLLAAKLLTVMVIAAVILVVGVLLDALLTVLVVGILTGNLDALKSLNATFWSDTRLYIATVAISMLATILMSAAVTVVGRSLAIGLSVALSWFPADNIGTIFFILGYKLTGSNFWTLVTGEFLGPNLNAMPSTMLSPAAARADVITTFVPLVPVTSSHTLIVTAVYCVIFLAVAVALTATRDVKE